jgi:hypothetical protein
MAHGNNGKGSNYGPSIPLTRLYERVSKSGNHYLTGRLGAARISILKSQELTDDGTPIWNVLLQEGPPPKAAENGEGDQRRGTTGTLSAREGSAGGDGDRAERADRRPTQAERDDAAKRDWQRPDLDDSMPF